MPTVTVQISDDAATRLAGRARRHRRSLEAEARSLLEESLASVPVHSLPSRSVPEASEEGPAGRRQGAVPLGGRPVDVPESYRLDLDRALAILKEFGCTEIYLFGSLAGGRTDELSDLDLAVRGCPHKQFFRVLARLMRALEHPVDLVDLDADDRFARRLLESESLVRVA